MPEHRSFLVASTPGEFRPRPFPIDDVSIVPAAVDDVGRCRRTWPFVQLLVALIFPLYSFPTVADDMRVLTTFDSSGADLDWRVINDNVMGGRSTGGFVVASGVLVFSGETNTDGGGFASIRSAARDLELGDCQGLRLRVRGDGRTYTFRLSTDETAISYWARFQTRQDGWQDVELPFSSFWPNRRGRGLDAPPVVPADIRELGIMINDKTDGPFKLEVDSIRAF